MKQKLLMIVIWISILCLTVSLIPNVHALPVSLKPLEGLDEMELIETHDRVYIAAFDDILFNDDVMSRMGPYIYKIDSLYETFIVSDADTGNIIYSYVGRTSILLDSTHYNKDGILKLSSQEDTTLLEDLGNFHMYFVKGREFSRVQSTITLKVDVEYPLDIQELNELFGAWDNQNGNITDSIVIINDNYTPNKHKPGLYKVTIEATDLSNNKTTYTYNVWVQDTKPPVVQPLEDIRISYAGKIDVGTLIDIVEATDNYTENLEISIDDENYTGNEHIVGQYYVDIMVDDYNGNAVTVRQHIYVIDDVAPIITGEVQYIIDIEDQFDLEMILESMSAIDEIDKDFIEVYIKSSDFKKHETGQFTVIIGAKDQFSNEATKEVFIEVLDNTPPVFFIKIPAINLDASNIHDANELLGLIKNLLTINYTEIEITQNDYEGNETKPGVYVVTLSANTGTEWIQIQTQVRVNETIPIQTDINSTNMHNIWIIIGVTLTLIVLIVGSSILIIKRRKSIRLK
ncbi:Ig-like domain-containing protein [Acholeplasma laidlawii]|uniref:Ig-like domain-containing protein n=1 Tax=Acholeplasma laidlawii TaxID=2148 RepID=UPI00084C7505|nr:Ig-like domain-containing protein [Acholeplasma laidlawii]OED59433.1 hypothetical protein BHS12_03745 [Acholeplasma laidlawii]